MKVLSNKATWMTGIAIFSMFFGAGNVVFPLLLGKLAGHQNSFAMLGLVLTAIGGPLLGLFSSMLFKGDFTAFFLRIGAVPAYLFMLVSSLLLGPFAVMPRCLIVSHAALQSFFPSLSLAAFSIICSLVIFFLIFRRSSLLGILGYVLSPLLIISLLIIIVVGLKGGAVHTVDLSKSEAFKQGLLVGYDTMDLIASIFFSVSIWNLLQTYMKSHKAFFTSKDELKMILSSGIIAGVLLGLIYMGFSFSAALHFEVLQDKRPEHLLTTLAYHTLGPTFGIIANIAIALACITTVMGLAVTFADILRKDFHMQKVTYPSMVLILLAITAAFSNLGFDRIMSFIHPAVEICYPAIIVMTLCNMLYKLYGFKMVKTPVGIALSITLALKIYPMIF